MARRIRYTGPPVLTVQDVVAWVRDDLANAETALIESVIIPTVTAQCEADTGAAIRQAEYEEAWPVGLIHGALDVGQATEVQTIIPVGSNGPAVPADQYRLQVGQRISHLTLEPGNSAQALRITYLAGIDLEAYPAVRAWMLMYAATLWGQREALVQGQIAPLPSPFLVSMLSDIIIPPRF